MTPLVLVEEPAPHVVQLALNRAEQLNAMTSELCEELHVQLRRLANERACRVVILTGAGRGFCAGVDLRGYGAAPGNDGSDEPATAWPTRSTCPRWCWGSELCHSR